MDINRINGLDLLKFVAVLMITNSHFIPLYKDHNIAFATLGVHGNALFFFISSFLTVSVIDRDMKAVSFLIG